MLYLCQKIILNYPNINKSNTREHAGLNEFIRKIPDFFVEIGEVEAYKKIKKTYLKTG